MCTKIPPFHGTLQSEDNHSNTSSSQYGATKDDANKDMDGAAEEGTVTTGMQMPKFNTDVILGDD